jgi:hypothetical protein
VFSFLTKNIEVGSTLYTDELAVYNYARRWGYDHDRVNHRRWEYVRGDVHTNTIEGFWSQMKRSIDGTHHQVSPVAAPLRRRTRLALLASALGACAAAGAVGSGGNGFAARESSVKNFPLLVCMEKSWLIHNPDVTWTVMVQSRVLDPHSDVGPALIDRCRVAHPTFPKTTEYIGVIAPDGGAEKRAYRVAASLGVPLYHAWKSRSVATGQLTGFGIEPIQPGRYLIVDDICDGGGTFIGLADVLDPNVEADLYVTHGLFTRGAQPLLDCFNRVYCTDSTLGEKPGVTILPRCASLLDSLLGTIL